MRTFAAALVLLLGCATIASADKPTANRPLIGTWAKQRMRMEDHEYPHDKAWEISIVFQADGKFSWKDKYAVEQLAEDEPTATSVRTGTSATGVYSVHGVQSGLITYKFDKPSPNALNQLQEFFSVWPNQRRGEQEFYFKDGLLVLKTEKTWIYLKRLEDKHVEK